MEPASAPAPSRSRPRDRRAEIARNAGELFSVRGFHAVRMDDIAEASGITARALYRHYRNKQALLAHVVREDQQRVIETLTALREQAPAERTLAASLTALTDAALEGRRLSLLWQREARHLDADDYRLVRRRTRLIAHQFGELLVRAGRDGLGDLDGLDGLDGLGDLDGLGGLGEACADIRSWVVVSIVSGPGLYDSPLPRQRLASELVAASTRVIKQPAALAPDSPVDDPVGRTPASRREQLIYAAAGEFRANGFSGVSIDDIGRQLDIVGPALYRYFDTKADILVAAVNRLHEWLALELTRAMRAPGPDESVLARLIGGYVRIALEATDLLAVWLTERLYLPPAVRERFDRIQADYIAEWQRWLSVARPELPDPRAATLVKAAKTIIDDCVRIPHLRAYRVLPAELSCAALATLGLPSG